MKLFIVSANYTTFHRREELMNLMYFHSLFSYTIMFVWHREKKVGNRNFENIFIVIQERNNQIITVYNHQRFYRPERVF